MEKKISVIGCALNFLQLNGDKTDAKKERRLKVSVLVKPEILDLVEGQTH